MQTSTQTVQGNADCCAYLAYHSTLSLPITNLTFSNVILHNQHLN